jgi:predicted dehydrogenase
MRLAGIKIGIAGAGLWAERAHVPAFTRLANVHIAGIADPNVERAKLLASKISNCAVYRDAHNMLSTGLDAIVIATPDDEHHALAKAALSGGVHVLCEKPLAKNVAEAYELAELASKSHVVTKIGFVLRYSAAMRRLRKLIESGFVGRIHSFVYFNNSPQFFHPREPFHWVMDATRTGGGVFVEYGCHGLDLARWLVGDMNDVCANAVRLVDERVDSASGKLQKVTVDDVCSWLVRFCNGAEGQFHVSWSSLVNFGFQVAVVGDKGVLGWRMTKHWPFAETLGCRQPEDEFETVGISDEYSRNTEWATTWRECFAASQARQFRDEVIGIVNPEGPDFSDGLKNQIALDAIARSLADRRWVSIKDL